MPAFRATVGGAAPLRIQLTAPATHSLKILGFAAEGMNTSGSASRPVLFRPSTVGSGSGTALPLDGFSTTQAVVVTNFSVAPSNPIVNEGAFTLPLVVRRRWNYAEAPVVPPGRTIILYASASGGHNWSGELEWDEGLA